MKMFEKWSKKTSNNESTHNVCFIINIKHFKCSNKYPALASQLARFVHEMPVSEGVALMIWFEIASYSVAVLQFDLQVIYYYENNNIFVENMLKIYKWICQPADNVQLTTVPLGAPAKRW